MEYKKIEHVQGPLERFFEDILWSGRWTVILAVIGGMFTASIMFYIATVDVYHLILNLFEYISTTDISAREALRSDAIGHAVEVIDGFLLAIVLLIFSYGIYELYISKIDLAYTDEASEHLLRINNLDDLKARLGKVILMILVVKFFEIAISMRVNSMEDLLMLAGSIILIGITLFMNQLIEYFVHPPRHNTSEYNTTRHPNRRQRDKEPSASTKPASEGES